MKLLYIGQYIERISSGADQVNKRNQQLLMTLFKEQVTFLDPSIKGIFDKFLFGINRRFIELAKRELDKGEYTHLFISQSHMGRIAKVVKLNYPSVVIINFFHNIEVQYAQEYFKTEGIRAVPFYLAVKRWETLGCKYSDKFITLNNRDTDLLKKIYNKEVTIELPTSFDDKFNIERTYEGMLNDDEQIDYLFVGVSFFANIHGVQWFIDNVMPYLKGNLYVVGKGMDTVPFKNIKPNIHIYGFVDDLSEFYYKARIVVSPIFVGGGMKTKTAEALMYGKTIVGTEEAFEGYEVDKRCMYTCVTASNFINTISSLQLCQRYNPYSRNLFNKFYSTSSLLNTIENIL